MSRAVSRTLAVIAGGVTAVGVVLLAIYSILAVVDHDPNHGLGITGGITGGFELVVLGLLLWLVYALHHAWRGRSHDKA